jgi:hypothetical protein
LQPVSDTRNSERTHSQLVKNPRVSMQSRQCARAYADALSPGTGPVGLESAQHCSTLFFFFFSGTLEIHKKL